MLSSATGNALERYSTRPFPPYRHEPGKTPHPERHEDGHMRELPPAARDDDFEFGVDLFNAGYYWEAHVYFERRWANASAEDATCLQGLIQIAASLVKRRAGNHGGEVTLARKSLEKLASVRESRAACMGIELDALIACVEKGDVPVLRLHR